MMTPDQMQAEIVRNQQLMNALASQRNTALDAVVNVTADFQLAAAEAAALREANAKLIARMAELEEQVKTLNNLTGIAPPDTGLAPVAH